MHLSQKRKYFGISWLAIVSLFISCGKPVLHSDVRDISANGWAIQDTIKFAVEVTDTSKTYNFFAAIKNTKDYDYSNILLFLNGKGPKQIATRDTMECFVAYPNGRWTGGSFGSEVSNKFLFKKDGKFPHPGTYHFNFTHAMRDSILENITNLALIIEQSE